MRRQLYDNRLIAAFRGVLTGTHQPRPPAGSDFIFSLFRALSATRSHSQGMPNPISYAEIDAYARLARVPVEPRHVSMILELDRVWITVHAKKQSNLSMGRPDLDNAPPLTLEGFDALFGRPS